MNSASAFLQQTSQLDCCGGLNNVDYNKIDTSVMADVFHYIDLTDAHFCAAVLVIIFNPIFWNVVARWEHKTRGLTNFFGSAHTACYSLGFLIILLNVYLSHSFTEAMRKQPKLELLESAEAFYSGLALLGIGYLFVFSSFYALGFTGTIFGDHFGILKKEKVTGFPFNIMDNPMYWGSTAVYLGITVMNASPVGMVLTALVAVTYKIAIGFEGPFTEEIYRQKTKSVKNK
ncbi:phosphatidylethanolamine N-methyltransferase isoform X2 [Acipenser ruthenus]|uniref:phosphatidylethanolamine N-methyltransferase isoform X2 n=2 Tax=Acipenser ruthenus TaxID=7906 RepID=UPI00145A7685|nr:phosphatidylethanolamine N-methyltransferase isoform X2 [Acipenser ruthenus]